MIPTFEIVELDMDFQEEPVKILRKTIGDKTYTQPVREDSATYQEYLRYTAWVEAGNNPEEFWTQSEVN